MKHFAIAALVAAATLIMAGSASAQQQQAVQANIPFSFTVNNHQLPAGTYTMWRDSSMSHVMYLEDRDNGIRVIALSSAVASVDEKSSELVFHKYGEQYFLSEIRSAGSSTDTQLPVSGAEKRARAAAEEAGLRVNTNRTVALNSYPSR